MQNKSSLVLAITASILALLAASHIGFAQDGIPRPVIWQEAQTGQDEGLKFAGIIQPRIETELAFRVLGRVISRKVEAGDVVAKDDVVAEIDSLSLQLSVTQANADLQNAKAQLENAQINERRKRILASKNSASEADLELAEQGLKSAQANTARAEADLSKAEEQLGYSKLTAEFPGVITSTSIEVGQTTTAGQAAVKLARLDQRDVVIDVPESQLRLINSGAVVNVALQLNEELRTTGRIREIAPQADTDTRTHRVKIAVDAAPSFFRFGSVVTITLPHAQQKTAIVLPRSAVTFKNGAAEIWLLDASSLTVSARAVELEAVRSDAPLIRVVSGLNVGEKIVVAGIEKLEQGQKVRLGQELRR
ncbi:efflux RND transporter periplasmic adaptor subunit [Rhizobium pusense]|jgi:RND family efflux transporter MFP subunit|uniref:efflux RND transporter periplasmic adaptor subunit n=1 Tax=Agrobacterium TaxID=357 RepID=UPI000DC02D7B|nr:MULTISPECIES: efflux RND transporter periplasmic adaptor subunit [Agrobacterium]MDH0117797.1 efflux RND transporter periplasmic adaptor subunit [Agrobacterium pusense]RAL97200.1 efflux transporter periplasmic adaptor subunit [Agrobacterium sp. MS2]